MGPRLVEMASGETITQHQIARAHLLDEGTQDMEALQDSLDEPGTQETPIPSPPKLIHEATTEDNLAEKGQKDLNRVFLCLRFIR